MAGRRNSYAIQHQDQSPFNGVGGGPSTYSDTNGNQGSGSGLGSGSGSGLGAEVGHIPDVWTPEEQSILEEGLFLYASSSALIRYARIAMRLPHKKVRDVALRAKWMNRKGNGKRRKEDNSKKNKDKRERENDSSLKPTQLPSQTRVQSNPAPPASLGNDDDISYRAIGGPTGELLEQNAQFFRQISANFASFQIQDNISLFCQARDNINKIMNNCSKKDSHELMKQMPPIPVKLNEELVSAILPQSVHQIRH